MIDTLVINYNNYFATCIKKSKSSFHTQEALQNAAVKLLTSKPVKIVQSIKYVRTVVLNELNNTYTRKQHKEEYVDVDIGYEWIPYSSKEEDALIAAKVIINNMSPAKKKIMNEFLIKGKLADIEGNRNTVKANYLLAIKELKEKLC